MTSFTPLANHIVAQIAGGYHNDPFSVLGPHADEDGVIIRAFLPQAAAVSVQLAQSEAPVEMTKTHEAGFFERFLPDQSWPLTYQFQVTTYDGTTFVRDDPYAFPTTLTDFNKLSQTGAYFPIYEYLGAHLKEINGRTGVRFAVWAPNALRVSVVGDFNQWDGRCHPMRWHHESGVWELFIPGLGQNTLYKYEIKTHYRGYTVTKSDPVGFASELRPHTASVVYELDQYQWHDDDWMRQRASHNALNAPISVYEVHLGSWQRKNGWEWLTYRDLIHTLIPYVKQMGFTHIELLPVAEHPFDGSWGYQVTGYFAATSRYGTPEELMAFIDACHQADIGVIIDWVPAHFPKDQHGLSFFDGTHLYEHANPLQGEHPDWGTLIFNYGRDEVRYFLLSNALFWLDKYHIDGLRVDAVASMLYLDFSRHPGQWIPNQYGGRENIEAIHFIRQFNQLVHEQFPHTLTIAEESTAWPGVTQPTSADGLGFDLKWNMGWMHDTLKYMANNPIHRSYHHGTLTFSLIYAFSEKFMLPFSHDEVVHLKKSMLDKMPGDTWQRFANLRLLYGYQWSHPGKKLLFMGGEFGQWHEWSEERSLDWHLLDGDEKHRGLQNFVRDVNHLYQTQPALYEDDFSWQGFQWLDLRDSQRSILAYARTAPDSQETILVICNFTPVVRHDYWLGVPEPGTYIEILNSDAHIYGGSQVVHEHALTSKPAPWHERGHAIPLTLPPLGVVFLKHLDEPPA